MSARRAKALAPGDHLVRFLEAETSEEHAELAVDLRRKVMLPAQDSNPKRTRETKRTRELADG